MSRKRKSSIKLPMHLKSYHPPVYHGANSHATTSSSSTSLLKDDFLLDDNQMVEELDDDPTQDSDISDIDKDEDDEKEERRDPTYKPVNGEDHTLKRVTVSKWTELMAIGCWSKRQAIKVIRLLRTWNILPKELGIGSILERSHHLRQCFQVHTISSEGSEGKYSFVSNIEDLFRKLELPFHPSSYRLFIDANALTLKFALIHNRVKEFAIPVCEGDGCAQKESHEAMQLVLELIHYYKHEWKCVADYKVVAMLFGIKGGSARFPCPLCYFDLRCVPQELYSRTEWPRRCDGDLAHGAKPGEKRLIPPERLIPPGFHIKSGLYTHFFHACAENHDQLVEYLKKNFLTLTV